MISKKYKFIFPEVPRTGSTSLHMASAKFADVSAPKHLDLSQYKRGFPKEYPKYFKFSFVRNPWARVVSLYTRNDGIKKKYSLSFKEFVDWIELSTDTCVMPTPKKDMLDFCMVDGQLEADFIGKLENFQEDFDTICFAIGLAPQKLPHANKSNHQPYTKFYDDATRSIVREKFARDIEYFDYEFGE